MQEGGSSRDFFLQQQKQFIAVNPGIFSECIHAIQTICDDDNTREKQHFFVAAFAAGNMKA